MSGLLLPLGPRPQGALCSNAMSHRRHIHVIPLNPHLNPFPDEKTGTQKGWGSYLFKVAHYCREVGSPKFFPLKPGSLPISASRARPGHLYFNALPTVSKSDPGMQRMLHKRTSVQAEPGTLTPNWGIDPACSLETSEEQGHRPDIGSCCY